MDNEMKEMFNIIIGKIDGLEARMDARMDGLEARMERMEDRQFNMDLSLSSLKVTVERIDQTQNEMLPEQRHMNEELRITNEKLDSLAESQNSTRLELKEVKTVAAKVAIIQENDISRNLGVINDNIVEINRQLKRLDKVEYKVESHDDRVFALEQAVRS